MTDHESGDEPPDGTSDSVPPNYRTDWHNIDERQRARHRSEAAGASRSLAASLLAGGR